MSEPPAGLNAQVVANLALVRERIASAAARAGRNPTEIVLVGVSKYVDHQATRALVRAGCCDLGEARPQSLWEKAEALAGEPIRWHLIGHLQRNKIRRTLPYVALLHAGDSTRLLAEVNSEAERLGRKIAVLLEVNISGDESKHGFSPEQLKSSLPEIAMLSQLDIRGLMTMAALAGGPDRARRDFDALREFRDELRLESPPHIGLDELSMGMSGDFEEAILAGATLIRVGSALWEGIAT